MTKDDITGQTEAYGFLTQGQDGQETSKSVKSDREANHNEMSHKKEHTQIVFIKHKDNSGTENLLKRIVRKSFLCFLIRQGK